MRRRVAFAVAVLGILLAVASCSGSGPGGTDAAPSVSPRTLAPGGPGPDAHPGAAWPTFGRDAARTGDATGVGTAGRRALAWQAHLDGAVYGQPLLVGHLVIAATENDSVYALDASTGQVEWRAHVGTPVPLSDLPCGDIDPLGITGTPVYDQGNGLIYAVAETSGYRHVLVGVSVASGAVRVERDIPAPDGQPRYDQQRPALAMLDGRVYVAFGGLYGDCGPYRGSVVGVPLSGSGQIISYVVPTAREGAIWGTARPVTGPGGTLYVSVGNGSVTSTQFDGSDSVTALSPALRRTGIFAPVTWRADSEGDLDLGRPSRPWPGTGCCWRWARAASPTCSTRLAWAASGARSRRRACARRTARPRSTAPPCTSRARAAGWPPSAWPTAGSGCCGAGRAARGARRWSAAGRSGSPITPPGRCTS